MQGESRAGLNYGASLQQQLAYYVHVPTPMMNATIVYYKHVLIMIFIKETCFVIGAILITGRRERQI